MNLLEPLLLDWLLAKSTHFCLVGSAALAVYGYVRETDDVDLMTMESSVLRSSYWAGYPSPPRITLPDDDDPLGGVVWLNTNPACQIIVGRGSAMRFAVESAVNMPGIPCPVVSQVGLVLLKLEAGGPIDRSDIQGLVDAQKSLANDAWLAGVDEQLEKMSAAAQQTWAQLRPLLK